MRSLSTIARLVVHRPKLVRLLVLGCAVILGTRQKFASEVLNLLPPQLSEPRSGRWIYTV